MGKGKKVIGILLILISIAALFTWEKWGKNRFLYEDVLVFTQNIEKGTVITEEMIDTVKMDGNGFTKKISDGAKVHAGDVLIEADLNAIKEAGHPATTMMILTNTDLYDSVECAAPGTVTGKSSVMKLTK